MKSSISLDKTLLGKIAYALAFCAVLPAFLLIWAVGLDQHLSLPSVAGHTAQGIAALAVGLVLVFMGMRGLWKDGKGLPMNAFPPTQLVSSGIYRWVPHPIYVGSVLTMIGLFLLFALRSGIWVITPCLIAGILALLYGYEIPDLKKRFGAHYRASALTLPAMVVAAPTIGQRLAGYVYVLLPWMVIYLFLAELLPVSVMHDTYMAFERSLAVQPWAVIIYILAYAWVGLAPLVAKKQASLRRFMLCGILGMVIGFACFIVLPFKATPRLFESVDVYNLNLLEWLLFSQRHMDTPACAFPSFHVFWAFAGMLVWKDRIPYAMALLIAVLISISCILTGMHSVVDVIAGALLYVVAVNYAWLYRTTLQLTEHIANNWKEWRIGCFRIINHGFYAGLASFFGIILAAILYPQVSSWWVFGVGAASMVGACLWGQKLEASSVLMRPFGYYGSVLGSAAGLLAILLFDGADSFWLTSAALATIAPLVQAVGRLRCLIQGCCHGKSSSAYHGICVHSSLSRVVRIAKLVNTPIYPTQLYSIAGNVLLLALTVSLTLYSAPATLIIGLYLIISACLRFVEEHYRGEPQTPVYAKLALYQWLAFSALLAGALLTMLPSPAASGMVQIANLSFASLGSAFLPALLLGAIGWFAMGMDWPESDIPLSRLT